MGLSRAGLVQKFERGATSSVSSLQQHATHWVLRKMVRGAGGLGCRFSRWKAIAEQKNSECRPANWGEFAGLHPEDARLGNDDVGKLLTCQENPKKEGGQSGKVSYKLDPWCGMETISSISAAWRSISKRCRDRTMFRIGPGEGRVCSIRNTFEELQARRLLCRQTCRAGATLPIKRLRNHGQQPLATPLSLRPAPLAVIPLQYGVPELDRL